jgi:hypothetical protein
MYGFGYTFQFSPIDTGALLPQAPVSFFKKPGCNFQAVGI